MFKIQCLNNLNIYLNLKSISMLSIFFFNAMQLALFWTFSLLENVKLTWIFSKYIETWY